MVLSLALCPFAGPAGERPRCLACTLPYAAPEVVRGLATSSEHIDSIAQDLWAVGCLMYEMITFHQLFDSGTADASRQAAITSQLARGTGMLLILSTIVLTLVVLNNTAV